MRPLLTRTVLLTVALGLVLPALAEADGRRGKHHKRRHDQGYDHRYDRGYGHHGDDRYDDSRHYDRHRYDRHHYDRHHYDRGRHHGRGGYSYYDSHGRFRVPKRITSEIHVHYQPYYYGSMYHQPHGHVHTIYSFPVATPYGWGYRPYAYCESKFFASGYLGPGGPSFSFGFRF